MKKAIFLLVFFWPSLLYAGTEDIIISEIMYDYPGGDNNHEWIEVYNASPESLEITTGSGSSAWRFFDGSNHVLNLQQGSSSIDSEDYFIIADNAEQFLLDYPGVTATVFDTSMNLRNSSSNISLSLDGGETYFAETFYDANWGANGNGSSLELNFDTNDWHESSQDGGTPGQVNSEELIVPEDNNDDEENQEPVIESLPYEIETYTDNIDGDSSEIHSHSSNSGLIISEFMPNPEGSDDGEWIELLNAGKNNIDLTGFSLQDNSTRIFYLNEDKYSDLILKPDEYFLIEKNKSKISLNNSGGDAVKLYDVSGLLIDEVVYEDVALEGKSFALQKDEFIWTTEPSPGKDNIFPENQPPQAVISLSGDDFMVGEPISLSAKESFDPEEGSLDYLWDFGDEITGDEELENHIYESAGKYLIKLIVSDKQGLEGTDSIIIDIQAEEVDLLLDEIESIDFDFSDLIISEFIPNPKGSDDGEWIELYNNSEQDINLLAWQIDDEDGGSQPFVIQEEKIISSHDYIILKREETKITLNNSNDSVRILNPVGEVWQEVSYAKIPEAKSYAWDIQNEEWFVAEPSPGQVNLLLEDEKLPEYIYSVYETKELDKKDKVTIQGLILNDVNKKVSSIYLLDWDGSQADYYNLIEIYFYKKDFPKLQKGQLVTVSGEISRAGNLPRLKIQSQEQISLNDILVSIDQQDVLEAEDVGEEHLDTYQKIRGIVVKKSGRNIYVASDIDEEALVRVYSKVSLRELAIKKGQEIIASGLLTETDKIPKLNIFETEDISVSQQVLGEKVVSEDKEINTSSEEIIINQVKNEKNIWPLVLIGTMAVVLAFILKKKKVL